MPFYAIAAMSENRVIGDHGKIPWHLPEDFRWFKHKTMGGTLIMGRKTFESIGKPLPGRKTLIVSHQPQEAFPVPTCTLASLYDRTKELDNYWVCGGGEIYRQLLDHCHYLYLSMVKREVSGDVLFPSPQQVAAHHDFEQVIHETEAFRVERWRHRKVPSEFELPLEAWPFPPKAMSNSGG